MLTDEWTGTEAALVKTLGVYLQNYVPSKKQFKKMKIEPAEVSALFDEVPQVKALHEKLIEQYKSGTPEDVLAKNFAEIQSVYRAFTREFGRRQATQDKLQANEAWVDHINSATAASAAPPAVDEGLMSKIRHGVAKIKQDVMIAKRDVKEHFMSKSQRMSLKKKRQLQPANYFLQPVQRVVKWKNMLEVMVKLQTPRQPAADKVLGQVKTLLTEINTALQGGGSASSSLSASSSSWIKGSFPSSSSAQPQRQEGVKIGARKARGARSARHLKLKVRRARKLRK